MARLARSLCICAAASYVGWLGEAVRLTSPPKTNRDGNHTKARHDNHTKTSHHYNQHGRRMSGRVALILRGEAFRGGKSSHQRIAMPEYTSVQTDNYLSQMEHVVRPFEDLGMEVDVLTAMYETPYDHLINESFGGRLVLLQHLRFKSSDQGKNAVLNIEAYESHANATGKEYRFVVFARHDTRFLQNVTDRMLRHKDPDDHVYLYHWHWLDKGNPSSTSKRCLENRVWFEPDRHSLNWWCNDQFQVIPQKFMPAFHRLLNGSQTVHPENVHSWMHGPRWPGECWGELKPLVGGDQHIDFFDQETLALCKVLNEHSTPRLPENDTATESKLRRSEVVVEEDALDEDLSYDWPYDGAGMPLKWIKNCEEVHR